MSLNKQVGNMYGWISHTWNPVAGMCSHDCVYCSTKRGRMRNSKKYHGPARLDHGAMDDNLGKGNTIFVAAATDMFAEGVGSDIIQSVLGRCREFPENQYVFQSKNPVRFVPFVNAFPTRCMFGTTIETDKDVGMVSKAPSPYRRMAGMQEFERAANERADREFFSWQTFVSIEPVMKFDPLKLSQIIIAIRPKFVSIGADSKSAHLPEPTSSDITELLDQLEGRTGVKLKDNLKRIMAGGR